MADYIYLLETRLNPSQREALARVRDAARTHGLTVFLVGGAVRDLTSGVAIRDLDVAVQGNALKLKKDLEKAGGLVTGSSDTYQSLYLTFAGGVRMEVGTTIALTYPKPGRPVVRPAGILDDLRSRDFTANAMAISLNEGSFGLLMDPLNGVADIENLELRLVSNYGFIEEPSRMMRAARLSSRLGWTLEERTQQRYETGKAENYIDALGSWERSYELEEIFHEEDPLRILRRLEAEGWMKILFPQWSSAKVNEPELERLRDLVGQFNVVGIFPDPSAAFFPLLTAKLGSKEVAELKQAFSRPGFVDEIESLETRAKAFGAQFSAKENAAASAAWKLLYSADPQAILSFFFSSRSPATKQRIEQFFQAWPQARHRIPYTLMQEMRITPDLPGYAELVDKLFFAIMDAKLDTPEAARAFLEPYSPPAPPPPPSVRRRPAKREGRASKKAAKAAARQAVPEGETIAAGAAGEKLSSTPATSAPARKALPPAKAVAAKSEPAKTAPAKASPAKAAAKAPARPSRAAQKPAAKAASPTRPPAKKAGPKPVEKAAPAKGAKRPLPKPSRAAKVVKHKPVATKTSKPAVKSTARKPLPAKKKPGSAAAKKRR
jgi:tRNA nucleotidyltransferase/poly(A) polymerase